MIKDQGPVLLRYRALLRNWPGDVADNVHPPAGGPATGNKVWPAQGLVTGGGRNVLGTDIEIVHLVGKD